ncbi:uncharacterized protein LOC128677833 isoform X4 [Plodia interpunctella]|uniref:uncharacterized protein LOC128677833 isoform X4 n=1 Tax=Plodia interpunctella TaxID=58824 RepID=UPI00236766ED|nr:uncharacterized protein LOC128677833 isoform X5 [Plodia interpunctella]
MYSQIIDSGIDCHLQSPLGLGWMGSTIVDGGMDSDETDIYELEFWTRKPRCDPKCNSNKKRPKCKQKCKDQDIYKLEFWTRQPPCSSCHALRQRASRPQSKNVINFGWLGEKKRPQLEEKRNERKDELKAPSERLSAYYIK